MKKWKTVKDEYHNINNILNFHRSTMHHKSNMSVNHIIPVIDNLLTKDNEGERAYFGNRGVACPEPESTEMDENRRGV